MKSTKETKTPKKIVKRYLKYPYITKTIIVWDPDWAWIEENRREYNCGSRSNFLRKLLHAEMSTGKFKAVIQKMAKRD